MYTAQTARDVHLNFFLNVWRNGPFDEHRLLWWLKELFGGALMKKFDPIPTRQRVSARMYEGARSGAGADRRHHGEQGHRHQGREGQGWRR